MQKEWKTQPFYNKYTCNNIVTKRTGCSDWSNPHSVIDISLNFNIVWELEPYILQQNTGFEKAKNINFKYPSVMCKK